MSIGQRIQERRQALKMSVIELARRAGLKPSTIYDLERGDSKSTTKLHRIAIVLKCSLNWLESGKGSQTPSVEELLLTVAEATPLYSWPFSFAQARFDRLTDQQRRQVERLVLLLIVDFETDHGAGVKKAIRRK